MIIRLTVLLLGLAGLTAHALETKPNVVFILCDNLGNGDVGALGSKLHRTPRIDRMAAQGRTFTSFYSASGVCTPSRAALMTGCYPRRLNLHVSDKGGAVLQPVSAKGLNPSEETIAELLKSVGYATACIGKWHLGDQPEFLPTRQGFDLFFGVPYSEDMTRDKRPTEWPELPLMRGEKVIEAPVDRDGLTRRYTEETIRFITDHQSQPFFVYLPHAMPGSTPDAFASPAFKDKSANGHYGDSIEELDWSAGEILATLQRLHLDERTLVILTSDNGAVFRNPPQGSNAPYSGWGYTTDEGGQRMPCIMRWPGRIPAGTVCDDIVTMMDILPTLIHLAGAPHPRLPIDGHDATAFLLDQPGAASRYDTAGFFYYQREQLQAVRAGPWKLYLPLDPKLGMGKTPGKGATLALYDVRHDLSETHEVAAEHEEVVKRLLGLADKARAELGDMDKPGTGQREAGWVKNPRPQVK
jgi:arylsulfatase A